MQKEYDEMSNEISEDNKKPHFVCFADLVASSLIVSGVCTVIHVSMCYILVLGLHMLSLSVFFKHVICFTVLVMDILPYTCCLLAQSP